MKLGKITNQVEFKIKCTYNYLEILVYFDNITTYMLCIIFARLTTLNEHWHAKKDNSNIFFKSSYKNTII